MRRHTFTLLIFTILTLYLTLFLQLGTLPFVGADEPRYAQIGFEMSESGDYVTPTLESRPWLEKPPMLFWLEAGSFQVFGKSEWAARLPSAFLAVLTLLVTAVLGYRIRGPRTALVSVLVLSTSFLFVAFFRSNATDAPLTAALTAALVTAFIATRSGSRVWSTLTGVLLGLGVLAKGPVAVILGCGILVVHSLLRRKLVWSPGQIGLASVAGAATSIPWFWLVWQENGYDFLVTFLLNHNLARFISDLHHHSQPFWYYVPVIAFGFFPWTLFLIPSLRRESGEINAEELDGRQFLWAWIAVPVLFFSASGSKLAGYVLPVLPALAVAVAIQWDRFAGLQLTVYRTMKKRLSWTRVALLLVGLTLPVAGLIFYRSWTVGSLLGVPLVAGAVALSLAPVRRAPAASFLTIVAAMTLFLACAYGFVGTRIVRYHSAREVLGSTVTLVSAEEPLVFYRYFHHTARYYVENQATDSSIHGLDGLLAYMEENRQDHFLVLTKEDGWIDLNGYFKTRLHNRVGNLYVAEVFPPDYFQQMESRPDQP